MEMEEKWNSEGPFMEYGSFLEVTILMSQSAAAKDQRESGIMRVLNEIYVVGTDHLDIRPSQKKQRV